MNGDPAIRLCLGAGFASVGSLVLLIFAPFAICLAPICGPLWIAGAFHLLGWYHLGAAARDWRFTASERRARAMCGAFGFSIVGFPIGLMTLPLLFLYEMGSDRLGTFLLWYGYFPFIPSVFAPVVFGHAMMFRMGLPEMFRDRGRSCVAVGTAFLTAVAATALAVQFFEWWRFAPSWLHLFLSFAGPSVIGYGLVAIGWKREICARSPGQPPAAPFG